MTLIPFLTNTEAHTTLLATNGENFKVYRDNINLKLSEIVRDAFHVSPFKVSFISESQISFVLQKDNEAKIYDSHTLQIQNDFQGITISNAAELPDGVSFVVRSNYYQFSFVYKKEEGKWRELVLASWCSDSVKFAIINDSSDHVSITPNPAHCCGAGGIINFFPNTVTWSLTMNLHGTIVN